jgi:Ca-activated chloride channel homolog
MKLIKIFFLLFLLIILNVTESYSQPDRSTNNKGVDAFESGDFTEAEVKFKKGLEKAPESFISNFNLGDALYKQERYDEAVSSYNAALGNTSDDIARAKIHHNIGNSLLKSNKIQESIEAYKTALKHNPDDADTKYNLSYALSLLNNQDQDQQQNQNQDNQDNNDQNQQDQQNQNQEQNQPQPKDQETQQDNLKQPQQQEAKISKEDAERILEALKNNEKDLQKELRKKTGRAVKTDKDW